MSTCVFLNKRQTHGHMHADLPFVKSRGIFRTDTCISVSVVSLTIMNWEGTNSTMKKIFLTE